MRAARRGTGGIRGLRQSGATRRSALAVLLLALALLWPLQQVRIATQVAAGYAAKVGCSLRFNAGQDLARVFRDYIADEVAPVGPLLQVQEYDRGVEVRIPGWVSARADFRPGLGCTLRTNGEPRPGKGAGEQQEATPVPDLARSWPLGDAPVREVPPAVQRAVDGAFAEPDEPVRRQTTAVLVAHRGQLIAERYAPGYGPQTPMLSWSMAKSLLATVVGVGVAEGRFDLHAPARVPEWQAQGDPRRAITLDQLLRMSSGLEFDERYGAINDVSRMLFTAPDMGAFAARSRAAATPDTTWSYSSGTSNIVARLVRDSFDGDTDAMRAWMRARVFTPAGLRSAMFEVDASGSPIGSSFAFLTARDWARLGELHRLDGMWEGRRVLPEGWVRYVTTPTPAAPQGRYGAHWWLNAGDPRDPAKRLWPSVPMDAFAALGHSGQYVVVIPSAELVVVRLGLSLTEDGREGVESLLSEVVRAVASR